MTNKEIVNDGFEQLSYAEQPHLEVERKLIPLQPDQFDPYKQLAVPIEQVYLSLPNEEYSLRVRASYSPDGDHYTACLKDKGVMTPYGLSRLEVETPISRETYLRYADNTQLPRIKKLRATLAPGVTVDWIEGVPDPLIEIEDSRNLHSAATFYEDYKSVLVDMTGEANLDNSVIAYEQYGLESENTPELNADMVVREMIAHLRTGKQHVTVAISGMSGSGKSTLAAEIETILIEQFGDQLPAPIRLSSDDYHRGKAWLEATHGAPWTNWDAPEVYDTETMATDLASLQAGRPVARRRFDFESEEVVVDGVITPSPFLIVEGIFAGSPDLNNVRDLHFTMPTPVATTIGRDISRIIHSNRSNASINNASQRLRYQLEVAIPTYEAQERPSRNIWSSSVRAIGQVAWRAQNRSVNPAQ